MPTRAWGMLLVLSVLWGGSFLFNRIAVAEIPTLTVVLSRVALASALLLIAARLTGVAMPADARGWRDHLVMGVLNNIIPFVLIVWGQRTIGAGLASIFNATTPIFGVIIAHLCTRDDKATPLKAAGIAAAFLGVAVLVGLDALAGLGDHLAADLACLAAAVSYGFSALWSRRFRGRPPIATAAGQLLCSTILLTPAVLLIDRPWTQPLPSAAAVAAVVALAALSTAVAYILFFRLTTLVGPTNTILVTFLIPPSAILLGIVVLGERPAPQHFVGVALIGLGLAAIDGRLFRRWRRAPERA
ncbi:DMT family transporter [Siculibacillus lacustris]|uniref:DMT family transporter n=1 Tax=Siculibacillus lacustris TaxID=1549641 RepID=A0A4Q9VKU7_9HYPH|nr:DMT family transporter [Siculibacillus lacustris]TBW35951.1 DMT family transporter [Siculibacillus lacustris]